MSTEKWEAPNSRGNVLTTQLNALADGSFCDPGSAIDNSTNLDMYGFVVVNVDFVSAPTARATIDIYAVISLDGTNYEDGDSTHQVSELAWLASVQVAAVTPAQILISNRFLLRGPFKHKFLARNRSGQAFPATGSTIALYTTNRAAS